MSQACQLRCDALEGQLDVLRKEIQATKRAAYRNKSPEEQFEELAGKPGVELTVPGNNHQVSLRTGDPPPENWR